MDHVAAPKLDGVQADDPGHPVHHLLAGDRLGVPGSPVGAATAGVGEDRPARPGDALHVVRPREHHGHEAAHPSARGERPGVLEVIEADAEDAPGLVDSHRHGDPVGAGVATGDQVLPPVLDPLEGDAEVVGGQHDGDLLGPHRALLTEAATDVALGGPDAVLGQPGDPGRRRPHLVDPLAGAPDAQLVAVGIPADHHAMGFHRHLGLAVLAEGGGHHVGGGGQHLVEVGMLGAEALHHVGRPIGMDEVDRVLGGQLGVEDRVEDLVGDLDQLAGVLGQVAAVGDDHGDGLTGEAHVAIGERSQGGDRRAEEHGRAQRAVDHRRQVGGGQHRPYAGADTGGGGVDPGDPGPGHVAADERHVAHAGNGHVVQVDAMTADQTGIFPPLHRLADEAAGGRRHRGGIDHAAVGHGWARIMPLRPAATRTCSTFLTWLGEVPRIWRTASMMLFKPWM